MYDPNDDLIEDEATLDGIYNSIDQLIFNISSGGAIEHSGWNGDFYPHVAKNYSMGLEQVQSNSMVVTFNEIELEVGGRSYAGLRFAEVITIPYRTALPELYSYITADPVENGWYGRFDRFAFGGVSYTAEFKNSEGNWVSSERIVDATPGMYIIRMKFADADEYITGVLNIGKQNIDIRSTLEDAYRANDTTVSWGDVFKVYQTDSDILADVELTKSITFINSSGESVELDPDVDYNMATGQVGSDPAVGGGEGKLVTILRYDGGARYLPAIRKLTTTVGPRAIELGVSTNHLLNYSQVRETDDDGNYVNVADMATAIMDSMYAKDLAQDENVSAETLTLIKDNTSITFTAKSNQEHAFTFKYVEDRDDPQYKTEDGKLIVQTETVTAGKLIITKFIEEDDSRSIKGVSFGDGAIVNILYDDSGTQTLELPYTAENNYYQIDAVDADTEVDNDDSGFNYIALPESASISTAQMISLGVQGSDYSDLSTLKQGTYKINFNVSGLSSEDYKFSQLDVEKLVVAEALTAEVDLFTRGVNRLNNNQEGSVEDRTILKESHFTSSDWNNNQFDEHAVTNDYFNVVIAGTETKLPESMTSDMLVRFDPNAISATLGIVNVEINNDMGGGMPGDEFGGEVLGGGMTETRYRSKLALDSFKLVSKVLVEDEEGEDGPAQTHETYEFAEIAFETEVTLVIPSFNVNGRIVKLNDWFNSNLTSEDDDGNEIPPFVLTDAHVSNADIDTNEALALIADDIDNVVPEIDTIYDIIAGNTTNESQEYWNNLLNNMHNHIEHYRMQYENQGNDWDTAEREARKTVMKRFILPALIAIREGKIEKLAVRVMPQENHYDNFPQDGRLEAWIDTSGQYTITFNIDNPDIQSINVGLISYTDTDDNAVTIEDFSLEKGDNPNISGALDNFINIKRRDNGPSVIMSNITMSIYREESSTEDPNYDLKRDLLDFLGSSSSRRTIQGSRYSRSQAVSTLSSLGVSGASSSTSSSVRAINRELRNSLSRFITVGPGVYQENFTENMRYVLARFAEIED